jgi:hypothetical protein
VKPSGRNARPSLLGSPASGRDVTVIPFNADAPPN